MSYYTDPAKYRPKCLAEKGEQCAIETCDAEENIQVHHIDGDRTNNTLENLIPVCKECHWKIHSEDKDELNEWTERLLPPEERGHLIRRKKLLKERKEKRTKQRRETRSKITMEIDAEYVGPFEVDSEGYIVLGEEYANSGVELAIVGAK